MRRGDTKTINVRSAHLTLPSGSQLLGLCSHKKCLTTVCTLPPACGQAMKTIAWLWKEWKWIIALYKLYEVKMHLVVSQCRLYSTKALLHGTSITRGPDST